MDPSITVFDYKHERVTEGIVQEIRVKDLDVGNGVGTVAFMSEDSVTEFHGSHEWAQGRKFLKLQFSCRGRRGKLTEVILENTFLDANGSFRSIFPNRGHYVYLVNKAQPLQGWEHVIKEDSVPSGDSGCPCHQVTGVGMDAMTEEASSSGAWSSGMAEDAAGPFAHAESCSVRLGRCSQCHEAMEQHRMTGHDCGGFICAFEAINPVDPSKHHCDCRPNIPPAIFVDGYTSGSDDGLSVEQPNQAPTAAVDPGSGLGACRR